MPCFGGTGTGVSCTEMTVSIMEVLVFEPHVTYLWCATHAQTRLHGPRVQPALVLWLGLNVIWAAHVVIEVQLLHEPVVRISEGPALTEENECGRDVECCRWDDGGVGLGIEGAAGERATARIPQ